MRRTTLRVAALLLLLTARPSAGQQIRVQGPDGPVYVGMPIELRVTAEGFKEEPQPEASVGAPAKGRLEFVGVSPNVSSSITIINGRVSQSKEVRFVYRYRYFATEPGLAEIGPFVLTQGSVTRRTGPVRLQVRQVPTSDRVRVVLRLPEKPRYVGERFPVTLEFWLESELRDNLHGYSLRAPLFDLAESFQFIDDPEARGDTDVRIETASGTLRLPGRLRETRSGGKRFAVVSVERSLVALRSGRFALAPSILIVDEATRWQRDLFRGRRATHVRKLRATDVPRVLEIKGVPKEGMPPSFAGAVGRGFTLEVTADRTVVQVGDPITLSFTLRGEGNLETATLPELDAEGLLPPSDFRVPEGDWTGRFEGEAKQFTAVVRVLDEGVREIPPIAYSWFDADEGTYVTTHSRPVALSVRPAEVIAAEDVFRASPEGDQDTERAGLPPSEARGGGFTLTGADLAIEHDPSLLLGRRRGALDAPWVPAGLYTGASLLVLAAALDRRRRNVDPVLARRQRRLQAELRRVREAAPLPGDRAIVEIAQALRQMIAELPDAREAELDAFLGECDARSFAPAARRESTELGGDFHARAMAFAQSIVDRARQ